MKRRRFRDIINVLLTAALTLLLWGCRDNLDFPPPSGIGADGMVEVSLTIPSLRSVRTRGNDISQDCKVEDVAVIVYSGEGSNSAPGQTMTIYADPEANPSTSSLTQNSEQLVNVKFKLNPELRGASGLRFYFIANIPENVTSLSSLTENQLLSATTEAQWNPSWATSVMTEGILTMSGYASLSDLSGGAVALTRNAAKVSVADADTYDSLGGDSEPNYYPYLICGPAIESGLLAGEQSESGAGLGEPQEISGFGHGTLSRPEYFHPTKNLNGECFILTQAKYENQYYWYRLDFSSERQPDGSPIYFSPTSNHWYQFVVRRVIGTGWDTPEEAALHPEAMLEYEIHDHCPRSYSMASDGIRELGVSKRIEYSGVANDGDSYSEQFLYIKFFSREGDEIPAASQVKSLISLPENPWLELGEPVDVTAQEAGVDSEFDRDDVGKVYRLPIRFLPTHSMGELKADIEVAWKGLRRNVPVTWMREFRGSDVTSASLTITRGGSATTIPDYWGFLYSAEENSSSAYSGPLLWGVGKEANNGKRRNQGFHFPVMYGDQEGGYAQYTYTLTFDKEERFFTGDYQWNLTYKGVNLHVLPLDVTKRPLTLQFTMDVPTAANPFDDYGYALGEMTIIIMFNGAAVPEIYNFDLYHTGFFHRDSQAHRLDTPRDATNYYYYEVVPVEVNGKTRYMLDRNLGAKSAGMYIRNSDGTSMTDDPSAAGGYYAVAHQLVNAYIDPVMFDSEPERVSPPGYRVPDQKEWEGIGNSRAFHMESAGDYFNAYYATSDSRIGNIYFPKAMMMQKGLIAGDGRSGYYWSRTAATGTEKEEIGKWLRMLKISGNTKSYINGCVVVPGKENLAYGGAVRCINDVNDHTEIRRTSFNVSGATHVYLYKEEFGTRTATTSWPGHAIGNYATMTDNHWFGFAYESADFDPDELYVIFNFVDSNGVIHTYSKDAPNGDTWGPTISTTSRNPSDCHGWRVVGDRSPALYNGAPDYPGGEPILPARRGSMLGCWWLCGTAAGAPHVYLYDMAPTKDYRIYWPCGKGRQLEMTYEGTSVNQLYGREGEMSEIFGYYSIDFSDRLATRRLTVGYPSTPSVATGSIGELFHLTAGDGIASLYLGRTQALTAVPKDVRDEIDATNGAPQDGYFRVYVYNRQGWDYVRLHHYDLYGHPLNSPWPGDDMNKYDEEGTILWLDIPTAHTHFILTTGANGAINTGAGAPFSSDPRAYYSN